MSASRHRLCTQRTRLRLQSIDALSDYSFITFSWLADGTCRAIGFSTQSFYIPDHGKKE